MKTLGLFRIALESFFLKKILLVLKKWHQTKVGMVGKKFQEYFFNLFTLKIAKIYF